MQERTVIDKKIRLKPKTANDYQDRGDKECCCAFVVFADDANFEERNDVTTVWHRKTNLSDTIQFQLFKNGVFAQNITSVAFSNLFGRYGVVTWNTILDTLGVGCYEIVTLYNSTEISRKKYELKRWSLEGVNKYPRLRGVLNHFHQYENLDFTNLNLVTDIRFKGMIGNRKSNPIINNLLYKDRKVKPVKTEYVYNYELQTNAESECVINEIERLLLSAVRFRAVDLSVNATNYEVVNLDLVLSKESANDLTYLGGSRKRKLLAILELYNQNDIARYV